MTHFLLSISRPGDLDLWPLTLKLVRIIAREVDNFPTDFMFIIINLNSHNTV